MNHQTIKKAEEIKNLVNSGYTSREILQLKFNRSRAKLEEHLKNTQELYSEQEINFLLEKGTQVSKIPANQFQNKSIALNAEIVSFDDLQAIKELINAKDKLMALLEPQTSIKTHNHLLIADKVSELKDNKITSFRISQELEKEFNEICNNYKSLSKTIIFNQAIFEFIENYK